MQNADRNNVDGEPGANHVKSMAIIDASPVPMALNDEQQRITYLNPAFVQTFGYTQDDIPSLSVWWPKAYPNPEYRQWVASAWQAELDRAKLSGTTFSPFEVVVQCKSGENKTVMASAAALSESFQGEHLVVLYDITERKEIDNELRESRQRLEMLSRQLIATQESERRHLARELHDDIGQILTAIKLNLRRTQRVADAGFKSHLEENVEMVDQAIQLVRNLALSLRPPQLDELGLVAALHGLIKHQAQLGGFDEHLDIALGDLQIPPDLETVCFRIAQEALTNAVRHAKPSIVNIRLWASDDQLHLQINDDGVGFDVAESHHQALRGNSFGVISMQERAHLAGGSVAIESTPGYGTTIHVWFPLPDATHSVR